MSYRHEVLGIGTPILDLLIYVNDPFLKKLSGTKGGAQSIDHDALIHLLEESGQQPFYAMGGSAANTIRGLAHLDRKCAFVGKIGKDAAGSQFLKEMQSLNIASHLIETPISTAQVLSLISPDHDRTMRYCVPTGIELQADDLSPSLFDNVSLVHIEGYTLLSPTPLTQTAMELAKNAGAKISFNLGSLEITHRFKKTILHLLQEYVDILIANEVETHALTSLDPEKGCDFLKNLCKTVIVTMGKEGCWAAQGSEKLFQPAYSVKVLDTTGAGDLFATGFLHGYLDERPLRTCVEYGTLLASEVIQNIGVVISPNAWKKIREKISKK